MQRGPELGPEVPAGRGLPSGPSPPPKPSDSEALVLGGKPSLCRGMMGPLRFGCSSKGMLMPRRRCAAPSGVPHAWVVLRGVRMPLVPWSGDAHARSSRDTALLPPAGTPPGTPLGKVLGTPLDTWPSTLPGTLLGTPLGASLSALPCAPPPTSAGGTASGEWLCAAAPAGGSVGAPGVAPGPSPLAPPFGPLPGGLPSRGGDVLVSGEERGRSRRETGEREPGPFCAASGRGGGPCSGPGPSSTSTSSAGLDICCPEWVDS